MKTRDHHPSAKVDAILQAARNLFAEQGFEYTPVAQVAENAKVAGGTVIYHFKTKENLLFIVCRQIVYDLFTSLRHAVRQAPDARSAMDAFVDAYSGFVEGRPLDYKVLLQSDPFQILDVSQPAFVDLRIFHSWIIRLLEDTLEQGVAGNEFPELPRCETAQLIASMLHCASKSYLHANEPCPALYPEIKVFVQARLAFAVHSR